MPSDSAQTLVSNRFLFVLRHAHNVTVRWLRFHASCIQWGLRYKAIPEKDLHQRYARLRKYMPVVSAPIIKRQSNYCHLQGKGNLVIPVVIGILGPSVRALRLVFKSILSREPWNRDLFVLPIPFRTEAEYNSSRDPKPAFSFMKDDGIVRPHPPIARALAIVEKALEASGHEVMKLPMARSLAASDLFIRS